MGLVTRMAFRLSPSISMSLSSSVDDPVVVNVTVPASSTSKVSVTVTGGSLTGLMMILTVTIVEETVPSLIRYPKVSEVVSEPS